MNLFDLPPFPLPEELTTVLVQNETVRIERIVSTGQTTEWYDQDKTEFVTLLEGKAEIEYGNGRIITLSKGDTLLIKKHEKHRVSYTSSEPPCVWLCVFWEDEIKCVTLKKQSET